MKKTATKKKKIVTKKNKVTKDARNVYAIQLEVAVPVVANTIAEASDMAAQWLQDNFKSNFSPEIIAGHEMTIIRDAELEDYDFTLEDHAIGADPGKKLRDYLEPETTIVFHGKTYRVIQSRVIMGATPCLEEIR